MLSYLQVVWSRRLRTSPGALRDSLTRRLSNDGFNLDGLRRTACWSSCQIHHAGEGSRWDSDDDDDRNRRRLGGGIPWSHSRLVSAGRERGIDRVTPWRAAVALGVSKVRHEDD